jgi:hypothetical protein
MGPTLSHHDQETTMEEAPVYATTAQPAEWGLPASQETKYTTERATGRIVNRDTGAAIPDDEPVFILRARDIHAQTVLESYFRECNNPDQMACARGEIDRFRAFAEQHPERMKEPDSSMRRLARRDTPAGSIDPDEALQPTNAAWPY